MRPWLAHWWMLLQRKLRLGDKGERVAARYLKRQGFRILARGHRNQAGEIDLIARDGNTLVFIEVKTRRQTTHGLPVEAVHYDKQRRLTRAALVYLKQRGWLERPSRFDVVAILWETDRPPAITHYRQAFTAVGNDSMY